MYIFEALYYNVNADKEIVKTIEVCEQFFNCEKEIFLYAMEKAYELKEDNEICSLQFIAC